MEEIAYYEREEELLLQQQMAELGQPVYSVGEHDATAPPDRYGDYREDEQGGLDDRYADLEEAYSTDDDFDEDGEFDEDDFDVDSMQKRSNAQPVLPFGRDSMELRGLLAAANAPLPTEEQAQYSSLVDDMQKIMAGEVQQTEWGTKMLTPVTEETEEVLHRERLEDEKAAAAEKAAARAREYERLKRSKKASPADSTDASPGSRRVRDYASPGYGEVPRGRTPQSSRELPKSKRASSAGRSRTSRDPSPRRAKEEPVGKNATRTGSASGTRKTPKETTPPKLPPRKEGLPPAATRAGRAAVRPTSGKSHSSLYGKPPPAKPRIATHGRRQGTVADSNDRKRAL